MSAMQAVSTPLLETDRVIVTRWDFAPGGATGFHTHQHDYVVVPMSTGRLRLVAADGTESEAELVTGTPYSRSAGVSHDVINPTTFDFSFIEIELK
jgi:quercetin dioxygenase-like cupin family protein